MVARQRGLHRAAKHAAGARRHDGSRPSGADQSRGGGHHQRRGQENHKEEERQQRRRLHERRLLRGPSARRTRRRSGRSGGSTQAPAPRQPPGAEALPRAPPQSRHRAREGKQGSPGSDGQAGGRDQAPEAGAGEDRRRPRTVPAQVQRRDGRKDQAHQGEVRARATASRLQHQKQQARDCAELAPRLPGAQRGRFGPKQQFGHRSGDAAQDRGRVQQRPNRQG